MERIQPPRNRGDLFTIGREHTLGHRLPVKFAYGAGDGWRVLWAWLDRAGEEEQRLLGRFAEGQLLVTLGRPRPLVLDPVAHGRHVVGEAVVHERHDAQIDRKSTRLNSSH